jgi:hypothetical protein
MKNPSFISRSLLTAWLLLLGFEVLIHAQTPPGLPKTTLEMGAPDSTGQKTLYLCFHTEPGLRYTQQMAKVEDITAYGMESSFNSDGASIYGLGTDVRLPIYVFAPPDPATQQPVDEQYPSPPSAVINLMLSTLPNGQGIAVSWSNAYGTFSARRVYPTANTLTGVPFAGTWRSADVDVIWSKMGEVETNDPASLNTPLDSNQQIQWTQIQTALPEILTGSGGATPLSYTNNPTTGPIAVNGRWFRLKVEYPDSDSDGIPDWLEFAGFTSGGSHYQSNPFTSDTDGDGITDAEEWAAGTNPYDASSHPYKVMAVTPAVGDAGSPLNGAVLFYFNDALPTGFALPPTTNLLWHVTTNTTITTTEEGVEVTTKTYSLDPVAGTYSILPGRKTVVFYPAQNLLLGPDNGDSGFPKFNYLYDVTTTSTGLSSLVPLTNLPATLPSPTYYYYGDLKGFSTTTLLDTVGPAVMKTSPSWNYVDVDPNSQPTVTWNQPLDLATVNSSNITLVEKDTGTPVACSVIFDYGTESYYDNNSTVRKWRPANKLKLVPNAALKNDTSYTITLGTSLTNLKGLPLLNTYAWSFHTRPAPAPIVAGAGPYIVSSNVAAYNKNVTTNGLPITLTFNQAMDASTLTTNNVHLNLHGSSQDEYVELSYDTASKTLTVAAYGLQPGKRYELKLDGGNIKGASGTGGSSGSGQSLQGAGTLRPFNTASSGGDDPDNPVGSPGTDGSGDPDQPANITLTLTTGDNDAGSYGSMTATLPDGSIQTFPIPGATDSYKTTESPEYPDGTTFEITPFFTKGSDDEVSHEKEEAGVRVSLGSASTDSGGGSSYLVFKESNGATTYQGSLSSGYYLAVCEPEADSLSTQSIGAPAPAAAGGGGPEKLFINKPFKPRTPEDVFKGFDDTGVFTYTSVGDANSSMTKTNSRIKLVIPGAGVSQKEEDKMELAVDDASTSYVKLNNQDQPVPITSNETLFDINGLSPSSTYGAKIVLRKVSDHEEIETLKVHVLQERTVHFTVFHASDEGPGRVPSSAIPSGVPSPSDIETELNDTFWKQANVHFIAAANPTFLNQCVGCFASDGKLYMYGSPPGSNLPFYDKIETLSGSGKFLRIYIVNKLVSAKSGDVLGSTPSHDGHTLHCFVSAASDKETYSHEAGHALHIPKDPDSAGHNDAKGPSGVEPLMSNNQGHQTRWMRQEDWRISNSEANRDDFQ